MNRRSVVLLTCAATLLAGLQSPAAAHDDELRSTDPRPRIGVMSELVARQKLTTYGITAVDSLRLVGNEYTVQAVYEGRPVTLQMNAQTGYLIEQGAATRLPVAATARDRIITDYQIRLNREDLVRPELIRPLEPIDRIQPPVNLPPIQR